MKSPAHVLLHVVSELKQRLERQMPTIPDWVSAAATERPRPVLDEAVTLGQVRENLGECTRCRLHRERTSIVFGQGNARARLMFVGEGPGAEEDRQGLAFVGKAGQLLTRIIAAIGLTRDDVYITNIVKCRPPGNREPQEDEVATCLPFLTRQIRVIRPRVLCCLGAAASRALLDTTDPISRLRGTFHEVEGVRVMPTYHPAFLLRNPGAKKEVWEDMQKVRQVYQEAE